MLKKIGVFGGTGMTGQCVVNAAVEKGIDVKILVRDESTVPEEFKGKPSIEIVKGDVLNKDDCAKTVQGCDAVVIVLGTRNNIQPTTMMSTGTQNIIDAMKQNNLKSFSACMSSFLFMDEDKVPKAFTDLNADHRRMLNIIKSSGLEYRAVLPPHIANEPTAPFKTLYDQSPGRTISKFDLGHFFIDCLTNKDHAEKVIGIATIK